MNTTEQIIKTINQNIHYNRADTFVNHLKSILFFNEGYSGEIKENEFKIWNYSHFWGRVFYAVIHGKVTFQNNKQKRGIETKPSVN